MALTTPSAATLTAAPLGAGIAVTTLYVLGLLALYYTTILRHTTEAKIDAARS